jgi:hypothetical protein
MPEPDDLPASPFATLRADVARMRRSGLRHAINDVDKVIDILTAAREQVAQGSCHLGHLADTDADRSGRWGPQPHCYEHDGPAKSN